MNNKLIAKLVMAVGIIIAIVGIVMIKTYCGPGCDDPTSPPSSLPVGIAVTGVAIGILGWGWHDIQDRGW